MGPLEDGKDPFGIETFKKLHESGWAHCIALEQIYICTAIPEPFQEINNLKFNEDQILIKVFSQYYLKHQQPHDRLWRMRFPTGT